MRDRTLRRPIPPGAIQTASSDLTPASARGHVTQLSVRWGPHCRQRGHRTPHGALKLVDAVAPHLEHDRIVVRDPADEVVSAVSGPDGLDLAPGERFVAALECLGKPPALRVASDQAGT